MPDRGDRPWGWIAASRAFLMIVAGLMAAWLAWVSDREPAPIPPLPTLAADPNIVPDPVLMALPGLGPALTARIVEARPFRSMDDLDRRVKGIGPAKVAGLKPYLRFDGPAALKP